MSLSKPIMIIGKHGQLARALARHCIVQNLDFIALCRNDCDLSRGFDNVVKNLENAPHISGVINAAAYTAVDQAETNKKEAYSINSEAAEAISAFCRDRTIPLVHVSTDYVFNGENHTPIKPEDPVDPLNIYGASKLAGEIGIQNSGIDAVILRTSWVFDGMGKNFMTTMLRLGQSQTSLTLVADQIGRPTYAGHLAQACLTALKAVISRPNNHSGIYHVSGAGSAISWAEFAKAIFDMASENLPHQITVTPANTEDYVTDARRPAYSVMDLSKFEDVFSVKLPDWRDGLKAAFEEWVNSGKDTSYAT